MQILLFVPRMGPLAHIHTYVNNTAEQGLANRGNVSTASSIGPMLRELALAARRQHIHVSVGRIPGKDNKMAESAPRLTHLPYRKFISHFRSHFPQNKPWRLLPLPSDYKRQLTTMLLNKQSPRVSRPPSSIKTLLPGANGGASAAGCKSPQTSKTLRIPFPFSIFFPSASVPDFCPRKGNPSRSDRLSSTSAQSVKYSHPWGPTTPDTTEWERSIFAWDVIWRPTRNRILLQQECGPSLSALSKPWTPPPREPHQEILQSAISPGSPYSFSSAQANTAREVPTPPSTP